MTRSAPLLTPILIIGALLAACSAKPPPPPRHDFDGIPVTGNYADAHAAGFTACIADNVSVRCRRTGLMIAGQGPYAGAIDLVGSDASGGFDHVTLWHDTDQSALVPVGDALKRQGWHNCLKGDREDYTRPGSPIRVAIDVSYWGKRRLIITREPPEAKARC
jgi:hypothetical protein